jgi:two-component sensor histidine kinase
MGETSSTALALVIHELATNSAKYGAPSLSSGTLDVSCNAHEYDVVVMWTERGGPPSLLRLSWKASEAGWCTEVWPLSLAAP